MLAQEVEKTFLCRLGLKPECPVHSIMIGGHNFVRITHKITGFNANTKRSIVNGDVIELTERELERIALKSKLKVVRRGSGKKAVSSVVSVEGKYYRPMARDIPVYNLIYVEVLNSKDNPHKAFDRPSFSETHKALLERVKSKDEELALKAKRLESEDAKNAEIRKGLQEEYERFDKLKEDAAKQAKEEQEKLQALRAQLAEEREALQKLLEDTKAKSKKK